jgi:putative flippase GtrA
MSGYRKWRPFALRREELARFLRFLVTGAGGFCVDAGVLMIGIHGFGLGPFVARFFSFSAAVTCTFGVNRVWAFRDRADIGPIRGFGLYLGVQGLGFACNLAVYSLLCLMPLAPWNAPIVSLSIASAVALFVNYSGVKAIVFRSDPTGKALRG